MTHHRAGTSSVSCNCIQSWKWKRPLAQARGHETASLCSRSGSTNSLCLSRLLSPPFCLHCCCAQQQSRSWCCHGAGLAQLPQQHRAEFGEQGWGTQGTHSPKEAGRKDRSWACGPLLEPILLSAMSSSWEHSCWMTFPKALGKEEGGKKKEGHFFFPNINSCNMKKPHTIAASSATAGGKELQLDMEIALPAQQLLGSQM